MHWIVSTLLMFVASVVLYLLVRKAALSKLPIYFNLLASYTIPPAIFLVSALVTKQSFTASFKDGAIVVVSAIFFAYLSNKASFKSIELAPNPGYSLVISKSYVVMTTLVAVPLFGAHLSLLSLLAVLLIVGFSALIILGGKTHHAKSATWLPLALFAFFGWGFMSLVAKYLFSHGWSPIMYLVYAQLTILACVLVEMYRHRVRVDFVSKHTGLFVLIGLSATSFTFFNFYSISIAPNVGYVNGANAASIAAVTVFAALLFKDDLSLKKVIGVFGVVAGLFLLFLG